MNISNRIYDNYKKSLKDYSFYSNRISSGSKISSAKSDPKIFYKTELLKSSIRSIQNVDKNLQDASSMLQVQDSGISDITNIISRMQELVIQSASGTTTSEGTDIIQNELNSLKESISSIVNNTEFNSVNVLNSEYVDNDIEKFIVFQVDKDVNVKIPLMNLSSMLLKESGDFSLCNLGVKTDEERKNSIAVLDKTLNKLTDIRTSIGSIANNIESSVESINDRNVLLEDDKSKLIDVDIARDMIDFSKTDLLKNAALAVIKQTNNLLRESISIVSKTS